MATISRIRPHLPETLLRCRPRRRPSRRRRSSSWPWRSVASVSPFWAVRPAAPEAPPPATVTETEAADLPRGDLPIIGDPIRDLTIWWSNRLTDANRAGLDSLRGRALTPIDPMADDVVKDLYGKILLITIPLLTLGGMILGYLIMTSRTTGRVGLHRPGGHAPLRRRRDAVGPRDLPRLGPRPVRHRHRPGDGRGLDTRQRGRRLRRLAGSGRRLRGPPEGELRSPDHARARTTGTTAPGCRPAWPRPC